MSTDPKPVGSPFQAPRDCILYGFSLEEKEQIARAQPSSRPCWQCGRRFLGTKHGDSACSDECRELREMCWRIARDDRFDRRLRDGESDPLLVETAFMPEHPSIDHTPTEKPHDHSIYAFCALCRKKLGPYTRRGDATKGLRKHMADHPQGDLFR